METGIQLKVLIQELGECLKLPNLALNNEGHVYLLIGETVGIHIHSLDPEKALLLYADLGELPIARMQEAAVMLLKANFLWRETGGGTFSLKGELIPHIILAQRVAWEGETASDLYKRLETMVRVAQSAMEFLAHEASEPAKEGYLGEEIEESHEVIGHWDMKG